MQTLSPLSRGGEEMAKSFLSSEKCGVRPVPEDAGASAASRTQYEPY